MFSTIDKMLNRRLEERRLFLSIPHEGLKGFYAHLWVRVERWMSPARLRGVRLGGVTQKASTDI